MKERVRPYVMASIRRYAGFPLAFVPDEGEIVLAARTPAGPFLRAVVTKVRRASQGKYRIDFVWLETCGHTVTGRGARQGEKGNAYITENDPAPLIRRTPATAPRNTEHVPGHDGGETD